jgi:crotonobetaine/carnitine-CoA ligase
MSQELPQEPSGCAYKGEWVLSSIIADRAQRFPDEVAVSTLDREVSYAELCDSAQRVATALQSLGVAPGDRVATMLDPSLDYLAAWFGTAWAGAVDVPVNTEFKGEFLQHVVRESQATVLAIDRRWLPRLDGLDLPDLAHVLLVGDGDDAAVPAGVAATALSEALASDPLTAPVPRQEHDLLYVMYTSGTTGPSKGAMLSNRGAMFNARTWLDILELSEHDVGYSMFPLFHVTARSAVVTSCLWARAKIALRNGFSATRFWDDVRASGATFFAYMGAVIHLLYAAEPRPDDGDNSLRVAFGAAAPPEIVEDFQRRFGVELLEVYGSTELGPTSAPTPGKVKRGTMGRVWPHQVIEIQDEEGNALPAGVEGEICARPAEPLAMFDGYWRQPRATIEAFRNLWFHTGDRGRFDDEGYLIFTDRMKDSIRRRGENISSFELERSVQNHPDVLECAAYAVPSELTEDEVMIAVVLRPGRQVDAAELFRYCVEHIPRFAVPTYLRFVDVLPKTPSQRIQKYKLREEGVTADAFDRNLLGVAVPR